MTSSPFVPRSVASLLAAITLTCTLTFSVSASETPPPALPENTFAYLHIQVAELRETPNLSVFTQLLNQVRSEASLLSTNYLGIDLTKLTDVTVVVAPFEQVVSSNSPDSFPFCVVVNFAQSFRPNDFISNLPEDWSETTVDGNTLYVGANGQALHVASNKTILIGSTPGINWWLNAEEDENERSLSQLLAASEDSGHINVGVDVRQIPVELRTGLPVQADWLNETEFASMDLYLDEVITLGLWLDFGTAEQTKSASKEVKALLNQGASFLASMANDFQAKLRDSDTSPDDAIGNLLALACVRQAAEQLENVEVSTDDATVIVKLEIDSTLLTTTIFAAVSIAEVGREASANFEAISEQLK
jgi:hypothetical protein